ncbi:type II toxin-antitoxin system SpoIISA family toxin [Paenibacillus sp. ACRSA]|uniref:type II toxin-antitoxin system SpoIISA family toxin n=1 Tax=Paenibacillus sp. ACRSA TaxID=2918211 RepID=UPI001EF71FC2|nr:type II toxin-antitoxin system SpoIISA family toxin [Paenibacillus sp. ACRSA]MCG7380043.1 type II toxin-antitoxin system SpoIISA family toxin [Paenibacillus sp. ACRSA]
MLMDLCRYLVKRKWWALSGLTMIISLTVLGFIYRDISGEILNKSKELYENGEKFYYGFFFVTMSGYLVSSVYEFRKNPETFTDDLWKYRKTYYTLFIVVVGIGIVTGYIDYRNWQVLLQLTAFIVFSDLGVFQTPNITKIWSAEFQHRTKIEKAIEVNEDFIKSTSMKMQVFSDVIKQTESYFAPKSPIHSWNEYRRELKQYLHLYTEKFRFKLELFDFKSEVQDDVTKVNIGISLGKLETLFFYEIDNTPGRENEPSQRMNCIEKLLSGEGIVVEHNKMIIVPIFGGKSALLGVKSSEGSSVDEADITNLINLARIFHWYMI